MGFEKQLDISTWLAIIINSYCVDWVKSIGCIYYSDSLLLYSYIQNVLLYNLNIDFSKYNTNLTLIRKRKGW